MTTIFISYRRSDSKPQSVRLHDRLARDFDRVFVDVDEMPIGKHFPTVLGETLRDCDAVLIVVGPDWLPAADDDGTLRLYNPQDFVRQEVEKALQAAARRGIPVVPVLVRGCGRLPDARKLPASLRPLSQLQTFEVREPPDFDADADRLVKQLKALLAGEAAGRPAEPAAAAQGGDATAMVGRDGAWRLIAEQAAQGRKLIVLTGPPGVGKTATADAFARWQLPDRPGDVVTIDAHREFHELSLVDAVGKAYPAEFFRDRDGVSFASLPLPALRHRAVALLVEHGAVVVLDGPGEASYPRDGTEELNLARETAAELAGKGVLVLVAARDEACGADHHPIRLQGLAAEKAEDLLRREFLQCDTSAGPDDVFRRLGGPDVVQELLARGSPGELIAAVRQAAAGPAAPVRPPGLLGRAAGCVRRTAELLLGDPTASRPTPPEVQSAGPASLFVVCILLLIISTGSLIFSYGTGSRMWARMFFRLAEAEDKVVPLAGAGTGGGLGPGLLVELGRSAFVIILMVLIAIGWFFRREAAQLIPRPPWARLGPRRLGLRSAFRLLFLGLTAYLAYITFVHHWYTGPRVLWMCNGNPFLQRRLESNDVTAMRELQDRPPDDRDKMNGEPPAEADADYDYYWRQCVLPYRWYFGYSFVMFVLAGPWVLTVCFYAVCSSLWNHLISQAQQLSRLPDDATPSEIEIRLRQCKATFVADMDRYLVLLLMLVISWAYHRWLDHYNLTGPAEEHTTEVIFFTLALWLLLFSGLLFTYQPLLREAAKRIPEGAALDEFCRRHSAFKFFYRTITGSSYFWLCVLGFAAVALKSIPLGLPG